MQSLTTFTKVWSLESHYEILQNPNIFARSALYVRLQKKIGMSFLSVRSFVRIIITFSCAAYGGVMGVAALWYFETKIFRNLKKDAR